MYQPGASMWSIAAAVILPLFLLSSRTQARSLRDVDVGSYLLVSCPSSQIIIIHRAQTYVRNPRNQLSGNPSSGRAALASRSACFQDLGLYDEIMRGIVRECSGRERCSSARPIEGNRAVRDVEGRYCGVNEGLRVHFRCVEGRKVLNMCTEIGGENGRQLSSFFNSYLSSEEYPPPAPSETDTSSQLPQERNSTNALPTASLPAQRSDQVCLCQVGIGRNEHLRVDMLDVPQSAELYVIPSQVLTGEEFPVKPSVSNGWARLCEPLHNFDNSSCGTPRIFHSPVTFAYQRKSLESASDQFLIKFSASKPEKDTLQLKCSVVNVERIHTTPIDSQIVTSSSNSSAILNLKDGEDTVIIIIVAVLVPIGFLLLVVLLLTYLICYYRRYRRICCIQRSCSRHKLPPPELLQLHRESQQTSASLLPPVCRGEEVATEQLLHTPSRYHGSPHHTDKDGYYSVVDDEGYANRSGENRRSDTDTSSMTGSFEPSCNDVIYQSIDDLPTECDQPGAANNNDRLPRVPDRVREKKPHLYTRVNLPKAGSRGNGLTTAGSPACQQSRLKAKSEGKDSRFLFSAAPQLASLDMDFSDFLVEADSIFDSSRNIASSPEKANSRNGNHGNGTPVMKHRYSTSVTSAHRQRMLSRDDLPPPPPVPPLLPNRRQGRSEKTVESEYMRPISIHDPDYNPLVVADELYVDEDRKSDSLEF